MVAVLVKVGKEMLWLLAALVVAALICWKLAFYDASKFTFDFHTHDTYLVVSAPLAVLPFFFIASFVIFMTKEFRHQYSRVIPAIIIFIAGISLIILPSIINLYFPLSFTGGWTFYPPLSALPDKEEEGILPRGVWKAITMAQVLVVLALLHVAFHLGKTKRK